MQTIVFRKDAKPISDYDVEKTYQLLKRHDVVEINNFLLLQRFRVGVHEKDIPNFKIRIEGCDGEIENSSDLPANGILGLSDNYLDRLLNL